VDKEKEFTYFSVRLGSIKGLESLQYPKTAFVLSSFATFFSLQNHHTATESATKALTTTLVPARTPPQYQIHITFFCAFFAKYSMLCSSMVSPCFRHLLFPRRRRPLESDPKSSLPLLLVSLEDDGESLRLRRGESLGPEDASESDGVGLRRGLDDDARRICPPTAPHWDIRLPVCVGGGSVARRCDARSRERERDRGEEQARRHRVVREEDRMRQN
jgi:hypothetical protein